MTITYGDVYLENERESSRYNFEVADTEMLYRHFREHEAEAGRCLDAGLPCRPTTTCSSAATPSTCSTRAASSA